MIEGVTMKLYDNEKVVKAIENILAKDYPYLKYDEAESKRASNPRGEKQYENQMDPDVLHVKVIDLEAPRDFGVLSDITNKLKKETNMNFFTGIVVNTGICCWQNKWTCFNIRKE